MNPDAPPRVHLRRATSGATFVGAAQYFLRKFFFRIFPVAVFGRASTNSMERGHLKWVRRLRQNSSNSDSLSLDPGFTTTNPLGTSLQVSSGTGITAAS